MIKTLLVLSTAAGLVLTVTAASAGTCTTEIGTLQKQLSSSDAGMGPTAAGAPGSTGTIVETGKLHPPTGAMNKETEGKAASSEDVLSQNQGAPTDSEASAAGQFGTPAGTAQALQSLERARQFDQSGDETACMNEVSKAKSQIGVQ
ncbi:MAG TPA: hypothetical protein VFE34_23500 [Dongiaceae bacterium]|jgi:hypothetical protein|nr:hypothetical protein [Dongiaceae bacterium]